MKIENIENVEKLNKRNYLAKVKTLLLLIFLLFISVPAQSQKMQDVVYLKNGSIIRGTIIEMIPDKTIKIESGDNLFVYNMEDIEKIVKEIDKKSSTNKKNFLTLNALGILFGQGLSLQYERRIGELSIQKTFEIAGGPTILLGT
jgi:hypothetical protein